MKTDLLSGRKKKEEEKSKRNSSQIPDLSDQEAVQKFFIQEVQVGEELMAMGNWLN